MKKSIVIGIIVTLVISLVVAIPAFAARPGSGSDGQRALFECDIVPTRIGDSDLEQGEAWIRADGSYKVEIEGVEFEGEEVDDEWYTVELHYGCGPHTDVELLEDMHVIDGEGKCEGNLEISDCLRCPRIRIYLDGNGEFTTGFEADWDD